MRSVEQRVRVSLKARSYDIVIKPGLMDEVATRLQSLASTERVGIVTDRHVARHYLSAVVSQCKQAGLHPVSIVLPPGEKNKTLATVGKILDVLAKERFERKSLLMALGGGVVGDMTGFAAAIYQRGIPFVQVPTTLVAQVDSSVGGKTGVDHRLGKNLIGAFHQPKAVWIDTMLLRTLPKREWIAGLAEVIKYGIIADSKFFSYLERVMPRLLKLEPQAVMQIVKRSCEIKAQVVAADELMPTAMALAERIAKGPPMAIELAKRLAYRGWRQELESQTEYEEYVQRLCIESEDAQEGVRSFLEKREPDFKGR